MLLAPREKRRGESEVCDVPQHPYQIFGSRGPNRGVRARAGAKWLGGLGVSGRAHTVNAPSTASFPASRLSILAVVAPMLCLKVQSGGHSFADLSASAKWTAEP